MNYTLKVLCVVDLILQPYSILGSFCWPDRDIQCTLNHFRIALLAIFCVQLMPINNNKFILRVYDFHIIILVLSKSEYKGN